MSQLGQHFADPEHESLLLGGQVRRVRRLWDGFTDFAFKDNIIEVALGLILASMFTTVVTSLTSDILLPPLSVIFPLNKNLHEKFAVLQAGPNYNAAKGYNTLKLAQDDGAVVLAYGLFLNRVLNFLGVGFSLYAMAGIYQLSVYLLPEIYFSHDPVIKHTVKCKYCRTSISSKCLRCVNCTSWLDGREDRLGGS